MKSQFIKSLYEHMMLKRYAKRTIQTYINWISDYIRFHKLQYPKDLDVLHVEAYLTHLSTKRKNARSTQATALNALVFLYNKYLEQPLPSDMNFVGSGRERKLPVVLTQLEVKALLGRVPTHHYLAVALLYGSGLRLMECVRLRTGDIDFDYKCVRIWFGKGGKHRVVTLSESLIPLLKNHMIPNLPNIDKDRIGMYGVSRGGMQSFLTLKRTNKVKALAVLGGPSDLKKELEFRPFMEKVYKRQIPNYMENKSAELTKRSVVNWVTSLPKTTPILLLHGENDK